MKLENKLQSLMARKQKGLAIWAIVLFIALFALIGVVLSQGTSGLGGDIVGEKRAESFASSVLTHAASVENAILIAQSRGDRLVEGSLLRPGITKETDQVAPTSLGNLIDNTVLGMTKNVAAVPREAFVLAQDVATDGIGAYDVASGRFLVSGLTDVVCEQINIGLDVVVDYTVEATDLLQIDEGCYDTSLNAGNAGTDRIYFKRIQ